LSFCGRKFLCKFAVAIYLLPVMYPYVRRKPKRQRQQPAAAQQTAAQQAAAPKATVPTPPVAVPAASVPVPVASVPVPVASASGKQTLRQRYPFLNEPDCPVETHALVGHRISQYNLYVKLYAQLRDCESLTELSTLCGKLLEAYIDNRQCTEELDYYQEHHKLLGKHHLMKHLRQLTDLRCKTTRELMEEQRRTQDNIWRAKSEIAKGTKPHLNQSREERIRTYELKLQEIERLLAL